MSWTEIDPRKARSKVKLFQERERNWYKEFNWMEKFSEIFWLESKTFSFNVSICNWMEHCAQLNLNKSFPCCALNETDFHLIRKIQFIFNKTKNFRKSRQRRIDHRMQQERRMDTKKIISLKMRTQWTINYYRTSSKVTKAQRTKWIVIAQSSLFSGQTQSGSEGLKMVLVTTIQSLQWNTQAWILQWLSRVQRSSTQLH